MPDGYENQFTLTQPYHAQWEINNRLINYNTAGDRRGGIAHPLLSPAVLSLIIDFPCFNEIKIAI